ncbi:autotransporter-associated beta strand repeat-containing protein [Comamonas terrigena]|uniref:autotransporter-associated beta strand repeat-containing protein n=1 Tax=Comamonas terrigena TaxID=32013 RepID=UPI0028A1C60F|nr:autotransporter-associated beta strand repeat-containing protein [Comamonas terrigena]
MLTLTGRIVGSGALTKTGTGILYLSNASNVFTGGVNLKGGTLSLGNAGALSSGAVSVTEASTLEFTTPITVVSNDITLGAELNVQGGANAVNLVGNITGTGTLNKQGTGVLVLSGANNFSGGLGLGGGNVVFDNAAAVGSGTLSVSGNSTLTNTAAVTLGNNIALNSNTLALASANATTLSGTISGSGGQLIKQGTGDLTLGGANTFGGGVQLQAGKLIIGSDAALGSGQLQAADGTTLDTNAARIVTNNVALGGNVTVAGSNDLTLTGNVSGNSGSLTKNGAGTLTLGGNSTYGGGVALNAGTLLVSNYGALGTGALTTAAGTTLGATTVPGSGVTLTNLVNLNGDLTLNGPNNLSLSGVVSGTGNLIKNGNSIVQLAAANTFQGDTILNAGTLYVSNAGGLSQGSLIANGGTLDAASAVTIANAITLNGAMAVGGLSNMALQGVIEGTGSLVKGGAANLTLTGANTYTGGTSLNGGTLTLGNAGAIGTGDLTVGGGATLATTASMNLGNALYLNAGLTLAGNDDLTLGGVIDGAGGLTKTGTGELTLSGANSYAGGTQLNGGTLVVGSSTALGSGALSAAANTSLQSNSAVSLSNSISLAGNLNVQGSSDLTLNGVIGGNSGSLAKQGTGTLTLGGNNTFTGDTLVNGGSLKMASTGHLASGQVTVVSGATLGGSGTLAGHVDIQAGATLAPGASNGTGALTVGSLNMAQGSHLAMALGAPGADFQTPGQGTSVSVTGNLELNGVTLSLADAGGFGPGLYRLFDYGGTLTMSNGGFAAKPTSSTIQFLTADKKINLINTQGLTLNVWNANGQASSTAMGGGSGTWSNTAAVWTDATGSLTAPMLPQPGFAIFGGTSGTVTLDGTAGAVQATGLQFASDGYRLNGDALTLVADAGHAAPVEIRVGDGSGASSAWTATLDNVLAGSDGLKKTGAGTLVLNGSNTYSGGTTVAAGKLSVGSDHNLGNTAGALTLDGGTVQVTGTAFSSNGSRNWALGSTGGGIDIADAANSFTLSSALTGNGSLLKTGAGTLTLTGANNYSGTTTIDAGKLVASVANLGSGAIINNADLELSQVSDATLTQSLSGSGTFTKTGAGKLTLAGANTSTGTTVISAGTLVASAANLASGAITNNAALELNQASDAAMAQAISGSGTFTKTGAGKLTLTGANTSTGTTVISAGTLVASAANLASGAITNNAALELNQASDATLAQSISGSGTFTKTGAGKLTLAGANSSTGTTVISAGTLVASSANLASGAITNNAALELNQASDVTLAQSISGSGTFTKTGAGKLTLAGANTATGETVISAGTLVASAANLASGAISNNAALELNQTSDATLTQSISGSGTFTKTGAGKLTLAGANSSTGTTVVSAGTLVASAANLASGAITNNAALELNQVSDAAMAQAISGSGSLTKTGAGTLTLTGDSSNYNGSTLIANGLLLLGGNGKLGGSLTVASGATLASTGSVGSAGRTVTVQSGATIAAGDASSAYGTLRVAGDLVLEQGATYQVKADPNSSASSLIKVAGSATLAGSVLHVGNESNAASDFQVGKTYTILQASQINGTFSAAASNFAYLNVGLDYLKTSGTTTDVTLTLERNDTAFASQAQTPNQASAATAIESLPRTHQLYKYVQTLATGAPAAVFASLSGDVQASVGGSLVGLGAFAPSVSGQHLRNNITAGFRAGAPVAQSDGPLPASAWPSSKALPAWAEVVGHWQRYDGDGNAAQLKQRTTGLFLGMDQEVGTSGWRLGGSLGYTQADGKVADRSSESDVNSYSAAVYGGKSFGTGTGPRINVLGGLAYTWHDIETTRRVSSLGQTLKADYSAHTAQLFAEVGYAIGQYDKVGFEPFAGVSLGQQRTGSFQEHGGFAALQGRSSTDDLASTTLGLRVHSDFQLAGKEGRMRATVGWRHAFGDLAQSKTMAFEGGQNFTVAGTPLARNTAVLGLEADVALSRSAALVLGYQGEMGSGQRDHSASVKLRWAF